MEFWFAIIFISVIVGGFSFMTTILENPQGEGVDKNRQ